MYIFEFKDTKDGVVFNRTLEKDLSLVEIYKKYEEIPAFILSKENAGELLNTIIEQIIESSDPPLISKNYHL